MDGRELLPVAFVLNLKSGSGSFPGIVNTHIEFILFLCGIYYVGYRVSLVTIFSGLLVLA